MKPAVLALAALALSTTSAAAGVSSVDLSQYALTGRFALPALAAEASAVTYNPDTGTLFVLGDEGDAVVEVSRTGALLSSMTLTGFDDTEGLTYIGGGAFVLTEERLQDAFRLPYAAGGAAARGGGLQGVSLGPTVGNVGIEGLSFDPSTGRYVVVKEKTPQAVLDASIDFAAGTASVSDLFVPNLGVLDLSDVQVLSVIPSLAGGPDFDNLLVYSQESSLLLEVTRGGAILSQFDFSLLAGDVEGVTVDSDGVIYLVGEAPELFVLTPIPAPSTVALAAAALGLAARRRRR